jgi:hypothetical protein
MQENYNLFNAHVFEAMLTGIIGAILGWGTVWLVLTLVPSFSALKGTAPSLVINLVGVLVSASNGVVSGQRRIYHWRDPLGWLAFCADSTWAILGTACTVLFLALSPLSRTALYQRAYSRRHNRLIYEGGFGLGGISQTFGLLARITPRHLIPSAMGDPETIFRAAVQHETLHILQNRLFGPVLYVSYLLWLPVGAVLGCLFGIFVKQPLLLSIWDMAYYNNPWEIWAWRWYGPPKGIHHGGLLSWA